MPEFFLDPTPEKQNVVIIQGAILHQAERDPIFIIFLLMTEPVRRY